MMGIKVVFQEDTSFCHDGCDNEGCYRHRSRILCPFVPHYYAGFKNTKYCPYFYKEETGKEFGEMELGNLLFGNSRGAYPIERFPAQDIFGEFLEKCGLDVYGHPEKDAPISSYLVPLSDGAFEIDTELFSLFPYYWGEDEELMVRANFVYKPENIEIQWYKYPLRDAYSNVELTAEKIRDILEKCSAFVQSLS